MEQNKKELVELLTVFLGREYQYWVDSIGEPKTKQIVFDILSHWAADNPDNKSMKEAKETVSMILDQVKPGKQKKSVINA